MYCLLIITLLAVFHDIKSYKIKNYIIVIGIVTGLFINFKEGGFQGIYYYLLAIFIPIVILLPLFLFKALGAGDIKLFSVIGCYLGISSVIKVIIFSLLMGGVMSLIYLLKTKGLSKRVYHLISYVSKMKQANSTILNKGRLNIKDIKILPYYEKEKHGREGVIHFSIAIFLGLLVFIFICETM